MKSRLRAIGSALGRRADVLVASALPLIAFVLRVGPGFLDPRSAAWLRWSETAQHLAGWRFFAREAWSWPPSAIAGWPAPMGTTIGLTDSIPLLALPLKLMLGARAADLQYFGLWIGLCLVLQGAAGALLLRELRVGRLTSALGGAMFGVSPVLSEHLARGHFSLGAQWLILGLALAWLRFHRSNGDRRHLRLAAGVVLIAVLVQPYLFLMVAALASALVLVALWQRRGRGAPAWIALAATLAALCLGLGWLAGFLGSRAASSASGFGSYSFDLGALVDPGDLSRFWGPLIPTGARSGEVAYLGAGVLALAALAVAGLGLERARAWVARRPRPARGESAPRSGLPSLGWTCALLGLLAALPVVSVFGVRIVSAHAPLESLGEIVQLFRVNGRLAWPLHYFLLLLILGALRRFERRPVVLALVMGTAFVLEAAEPRASPPWPEGPLPQPHRIEAWRGAAEGADHLVLVPPYLQDGARVYCGGSRPNDSWVVPALMAARLGLSFNSGYVARLDRDAALEACRAVSVESIAQAPDPRTLYAVRGKAVRRLASLSKRLTCRPAGSTLSLCRTVGGAGRQGDLDGE